MTTPRFYCFSIAALAILAAPMAIKVIVEVRTDQAKELRLTHFCRSASDADVIEGLCDTVRMPAMPFRA
jgi:hypothetical protein